MSPWKPSNEPPCGISQPESGYFLHPQSLTGKAHPLTHGMACTAAVDPELLAALCLSLLSPLPSQCWLFPVDHTSQTRPSSQQWAGTLSNKQKLRQEVDGLQARHLQPASYSHFLEQKKMGSRPDIHYQPPVYISWGKRQMGSGLHIYDQPPVYILRSTLQYKKQQE